VARHGAGKAGSALEWQQQEDCSSSAAQKKWDKQTQTQSRVLGDMERKGLTGLCIQFRSEE